MPSLKASVFISYSRQDQKFVRQLMESLSKEGREVWVDWESIEKGEAWLDRIKTGIENQDTFMFVVSPDSLISEICNIEVAHAIQHGKRIIPLVRRDVVKDRKPLPEILTAWFGTTWANMAENNWAKLAALNSLYCREVDDFATVITELIEAINTDLDHLILHTNLIRRALDWQRRNRTAGFLLREDELIEAEAWLTASNIEAKDPPPTQLHRDYIAASRTYENHIIRRLRLLQRTTTVFLVVVFGFLLIAVLASITAKKATHDAQQAANQQQTANAGLASAQAKGTQIATSIDEQTSLAESRRLSSYAAEILNRGSGSPELAALLGLAAANQMRSREALTELARAIPLFSTKAIFSDHPGIILDAEFTSEGDFVATATVDNIIRYWDITESRLVLNFLGHEDAVWCLAFSADNKYLFSGSRDTTVCMLSKPLGHERQCFKRWFTPKVYSENLNGCLSQ